MNNFIFIFMIPATIFGVATIVFCFTRFNKTQREIVTEKYISGYKPPEILIE